MKMYRECSLTNFEPWAGAVDRFKVFTAEQLEKLDSLLDDGVFPEGASETEINNLFWFEEDFLSKMLGFEDFKALERLNNGEEEEGEEEED